MVTSADGKQTELETSRTVIATGSKPASLPGVIIDKKRIISSTEALVLKEVPKHLIVIGGGVGNIDEIYTEGPEELKNYIFNSRVVETPFLKPKLGDSAGVFGAAALVA